MAISRPTVEGLGQSRPTEPGEAPHAGPPPHLARERRAGDVVAQAVRPVRERAARLAKRAEGATSPPPRKAAETPERKRRRVQGEALEAELDEALTRDA